MARYAPRKFERSRYPGSEDWVDGLLSDLNAQSELLQRVLLRGLSLSENSAVELRDVTFTAPDPTWLAPTLLNSWVDLGSGYAAGGILILPGGEIQLRGTFKNGVIGTALFNLPTGTWPIGHLGFGTESNGAHAVCTVMSTGAVTANSGNNASFSVSGIRFRAATQVALPPPMTWSEDPPMIQHGLSDVIDVRVMSWRALDADRSSAMGSPQIEWEKTAGSIIRISAVWGLQPGRRYTMRLLLTSG